MIFATGQFTLSHAFWSLFKRDFLIAYRNQGELLQPMMFFLIVVALFPLAIDPDPGFLQQIAPGAIWVAALLSTMLALEGMFRSDYEDGTLEQLLLSPHPLSALVMAKVLVHWLVSGLPLIIISPLLALILNLPFHAYGTLILSLLIGTPAMSLIGAIGVALTVAIKRGGILLTLLVIPLFIPILIFGAGAVKTVSLGIDANGHLLLLGSLLMLCATLAPIAISTALKISLN